MRGTDRRQLVTLTGAVLGLHVLGWGAMWLWVAPHYPFMLGLGGLAYAFGLRHAFDADHIAAIDTTTRKLMRPDRRPLGVGFFFSLGHSTIVFLLTLAIAFGARAVAGELPRLRAFGETLGGTISGVFLYAMAFVNIAVMLDVHRVFRAMRRGELDATAMEARLTSGGPIVRWFGGLFRLVSKPWHMYLVGFLFGLGFDTATEVGLLTTAGVAASQELPLLAVLTLPIIFAAGMSLLDSADGIVMCGAYGWAFKNPLRKVFYNLTVTGLSAIVALVIGTMQLVSIVGVRLLHIDGATMGLAVAALFVGSWVISMLVWKIGKFDERWSGARS